MRKFLVVLMVLAVVPVAGRAEEVPTPEPGFVQPLARMGTCLRPDPANPGGTIDPYGTSCARLKFSYGPIVVQPGDNSVGLKVKSIEKPWYDGYMVGIAPDLVRPDGSVPPIESIHLHHATWLSSPSYGNGPFFAAGEEKTVARFPVGYGMPVKATDVWYFVHMIHNEGPAPEVVYVTYHVDYIAKGVADNMTFDWGKGMRPIKPFWLDVWKNGDHASYPVYNTQRGYGEAITDPVTLDIIRDPLTGRPFATTECTWPRDRCAFHDSFGRLDVGQGEPGNGKGTDIFAETNMSGTLIGIGGHLHPGGTRVEVDVVRCTDGAAIRPGNTISSWTGLRCPADADDDGITEEARRIFTSDAVYFDDERTVIGENTPTSWNFSMTVAGLPRWRVNLRPGQFLRINSVYETTLSNWYENMGIAVAYVWPGGFEGVDPFGSETVIVDDMPGQECWDTYGGDPVSANVICTRGSITHGPLPEASNRGGRNIEPWTAGDGPLTDTIHMGGFLYAPGDLATILNQPEDIRTVPTVKVDAPLTFVNEDMGANIYHTATACAFPCNGSTGIAYPLADFGFGRRADGPLSLDTSELGLSPDFGPARSQIGVGQTNDQLNNPVEFVRHGLTFTFTPADYGLEPGTIYTYFCRIHPFMRGAFKVVD